MEKHEVLKRTLAEGLVPLIRASSVSDAMDVATAIKNGGASFLEVTMTVPGTIEVVKELSLRYRDGFIIGAGTVLDAETGRAAILAGAQFIVSPTLKFELISLAHRYSVVVIPGAMSPAEILTAWEAGADLVKVFPAGQLGGPDYIRAVKGPFPQILLMTAGGVNIDNAGDFIRAESAAVAVGSELVQKKAVKEKAFHIIVENTRAFIEVIREAKAA